MTGPTCRKQPALKLKPGYLLYENKPKFFLLDDQTDISFVEYELVKNLVAYEFSVEIPIFFKDCCCFLSTAVNTGCGLA